jgi:hypothetical protein
MPSCAASAEAEAELKKILADLLPGTPITVQD